ncbi:MAG: DUF2726 domain-containing protein [Rhizobacter sp.]
MTTLLISLIVLVAVIFWYIRIRPGQARVGDSPEHVDTVIGWQPRATRLMTAAEQQAYDTLREALPEYMVLSQVPLARFIKVGTRYSYAEWLRRVGNQCADLVVCNRSSKVLAVIEIHSKTSDSNPRAAKRHARKARSLKAAGVALHVWSEQGLPSAAKVRALLWSSSEATTELAGLAPPASPAPVAANVVQLPTKATQATVARHHDDAVVVDDGAEFNDAPPSTWFDDLDSSPMPLAPLTTNNTPAVQRSRQ